MIEDGVGAITHSSLGLIRYWIGYEEIKRPLKDRREGALMEGDRKAGGYNRTCGKGYKASPALDGTPDFGKVKLLSLGNTWLGFYLNPLNGRGFRQGIGSGELTAALPNRLGIRPGDQVGQSKPYR